MTGISQTLTSRCTLTQLWSVSLASGTQNPSAIKSPVVVNGVIYATTGSKLYAVSLATGDTLWQTARRGNLLSPSYDNGPVTHERCRSVVP
jgi:outer membrane protein assembly factor BamB